MRYLIRGLIGILVVASFFSRSKTGRENPQTRKLSLLGYVMNAKKILSSNIREWLLNPNVELFPAIIQIQTINRCNGRCIMCPYPYTVHQEEKGIMDRETFRKIAEECSNEASLQAFIPMAQTEPLLDPDLAWRIRLFKRIAMPHQRVELVTNGSLLTPEVFSELSESGTDIISVSVNAHSESTYNQIMKGLDWHKVLSNLLAVSQMNRSKTNLFVRFVKQKDNFIEYRAFRKDWLKRGWNVLGIEVNNRSSSLEEYEGVKEPAEAKSSFKMWLRKYAAKEVFPVCPYAFSHIHVLHNGDVPLCINDFEHHEIVGNVKQQSIKDIFNSETFRNVRQLMKQGRYNEIETCKNCTLWQDSNWL